MRLALVITVMFLMLHCEHEDTTQTTASISQEERSGYWANGSTIYKDSTPIMLFGVNWFGFEGDEYVVHGLWDRSYKDMIAQIKTLGFTAVRLPFCPMTLRNVTPGYIDTSLNPDLKGLQSLDLLDRIMGDLNAQGLFVLLDHHRPDCEEISELWYTDTYSEAAWIDDLSFVATRYEDMPYFLGLDLKNEPHGAATWGAGNGGTDWNRAAERAAAAILAANPHILIFVEGIQENNGLCTSKGGHWWGGNLEPFACTPLAIPEDRLVVSPHVYGPDVGNQSYFSDPAFPANMPAIWDRHFGSQSADLAIVPGEFGGKYGHGGDPKDFVWQNAFVDYLIDRKICNFFYWAWNPNSGSTGGILQDDWQSLWQDKIDNLRRLMSACQSE